MRSKLDNALVRDFPCLYRDRRSDSRETQMSAGFPGHSSPARRSARPFVRETRMCDAFPGNGWEPLLRRMSEKIEPFCVGTDLRAFQVKEKFGALRVSLESSGPIPDEVHAAVSHAVGESLITCEWCGAAGQLRRLKWTRTLCADCATRAAEWERRSRTEGRK